MEELIKQLTVSKQLRNMGKRGLGDKQPDYQQWVSYLNKVGVMANIS
jgi:hypothetical protein